MEWLERWTYTQSIPFLGGWEKETCPPPPSLSLSLSLILPLYVYIYIYIYVLLGYLGTFFTWWTAMCRGIMWIMRHMYSRHELFLCPLEWYFCVYFPRCVTTLEISTKLTLSCELKQFVIRVHSLYISIVFKVMGYGEEAFFLVTDALSTVLWIEEVAFPAIQCVFKCGNLFGALIYESFSECN